jgi:pyruvate/2-oxoglutarate dehydrogenase complex dihydrolipoamide dehydrogenase (E3) component
LGVHANEAQVVSLAPDEVVVATGSQAIHLSIPGLEKVYSGLDVLSGRMEFGKRALVIGGGLVGIEVAEYLAEKAVSVVVVEAFDEIARDMEPITRKMTMSRLQGLAVTIHRSARVMRVEKGAVFIRRDGFSEEESIGYFDSFVMAVGNRAVDELSENLRNEGLKVHVIGDAMAPKQVWDATQAAYQLARTL